MFCAEIELWIYIKSRPAYLSGGAFLWEPAPYISSNMADVAANTITGVHP